ncbi:MAG: type II toxin-antitoxin system HicA family toxin [Spirochaetaceae bacterium]
MSRLTPVSREELIRRLRRLGFEGPFKGGKHQFMLRRQLRLTLPNPHKQTISVDLLKRILRQAGVDRNEWLETS